MGMIMRNETKYCINSCLYGLRCIITSNISFSWIGILLSNASASINWWVYLRMEVWTYNWCCDTALIFSIYRYASYLSMGILMAAELGTYGALSGFLYDIKRE